MCANLALSAALEGDLPGAIEAGDTGVALAERCGNPTLVAYASFALGMVHGVAGDAEGAAADLRLALSLAVEVRNAWISAMAGVSTNWAAADLDPAETLARGLDAVDALQRTGWATHAWNAAWFLPQWLLTLGRAEEAAFVQGACATSGVNAVLADAHIELAALPGMGDPALIARYRQGERRTLAEIIRVLRGEAPLPVVR